MLSIVASDLTSQRPPFPPDLSSVKAWLANKVPGRRLLLWQDTMTKSTQKESIVFGDSQYERVRNHDHRWQGAWQQA